MKHRSWFPTCAVLLVLMQTTGCASVPSQEMSDARRAIRSAQKADAERLAPGALDRARSSLDDARVALAREDYPAAEKAARAARSAAIDARALATEIELTTLSITEARRAGRPVAGAEEFLALARSAADRGDTHRALELMTRARALAR